MASMSRGARGQRFTLGVGGLVAETFVVVCFTLHEQFSTSFTLAIEVASDNAPVARVMDYKE